MPSQTSAITAPAIETIAPRKRGGGLSRDAIHSALDELHRPRLLVEAARHGMTQYQRRRDLRRMLRIAIPANAEAALRILVPIEAELEARRTAEGKGYSSARHVDILTALMSEASDFKANRIAEPVRRTRRYLRPI